MEARSDATTDEIRVVVAEMPRLLAAVVCKALEMETDMVIVAQADSPQAVADAAAGPVDVIITAAGPGGLSMPYRAALFGGRATPIVAISPDGNRIDVYGRRVAHGFGVDALIALIRQTVAGSRRSSGG